MIQANYPSTSVQIIPDFTLYWIIELREYLRYAPKDGVIENNLLGTVMKALSAFETYSLENGLVGMMPYWNFVDWVPGWDFGIPPGGREGEPLTFTSMLYCYALRAAGEIFDFFGKANAYAFMADSLTEKIRNLCYDEDAGLFRNTPTRREFSQMVLGVRPLGNYGEGIEIRPDFTSLDLDFAEGNVPVPSGSLFVSWRKTADGKFDVSVNGKTYAGCENEWRKKKYRG